MCILKVLSPVSFGYVKILNWAKRVKKFTIDLDMETFMSAGAVRDVLAII